MQRRLSQALLGGAQWQDQRQRAHAETEKVPSEHQETLFLLRVTEQCQRLPGEAVNSPSLEILKSCRDVVLGSWL